MCLIVFSWQQHKRWPLLVAANRDEFHRRPAAAARFWEEHPQVLAGRDLEAGGTWLGFSKRGRFAAITNVRDPEGGDGKAPRSRGELTADFLAGHSSPADYLQTLAPRAGDYLGFNLLAGDGDSLWYLHGGSTPQRLAPGLYGLSNAALDVPWPKVERARQRLASLVGDGINSAPCHRQLRSCTADRSLAEPEMLAGHGLKGEMAVALSAQFIVTPAYGTRCMTTLRQGRGQDWDFEEQRFDADGKLLGEVHFAGTA